MKIFKKALALVMLIIMIANISVFAVSFSDVTANSEAERYISLMAEKGIIKGVSENSFAPDAACTREQFLTFLWRAENCPEPEKASTFIDITGEEYFSKAVSWAYENGITKIYEDGSFGVGKSIDREHAVYYLYNFAKLTNKADTKKTALLNPYSDKGAISLDSVLPVAWAVEFGILTPEADGTLNPKGEINRAFAVTAIGKLLEYHMHDWSEWEDLGNGKHKRTCKTDASHTEEGAHTFNAGELTKAPTDTASGLITYTCTYCKITKTEEVKPGTEIVTRKDVEDAVIAVATAYHAKGTKMQYDSTALSDVSANYGGTTRMTSRSAPEWATEDSTFYSVCTNYIYQSYNEALSKEFMNGTISIPFGTMITFDLFGYAENQAQTPLTEGTVNEPFTDEDINTALFRWMNFDTAMDYYVESQWARLLVDFAGRGLFESSKFTDYTENLVFKDDSFEGGYHYGYYDSEGNPLTADEVKANYGMAFVNNHEENLRPGDVYVNHSHTWIYTGGERTLECGGRKIKTATGEDQIEAAGAISDQASPMWPLKSSGSKSLTIVRPSLFLAPAGFDEDDGNDIIPDVTISEATKSRLKYPSMDIDRTVDITPFGTVSQGENITYTVKISNKTNTEFYATFFKGPMANQPYKNIVVTETIPEGTELVENSIVGGGEYKDGKITWNIAEIPSGETAVLSYTVKAVGEIGTTIVNGGGMVDNIPSNIIENKIGSTKLSEEDKTALSGMENLESFGADTDFAENIYKALGEELSLPTASEIAEEFFTVETFIRDTTSYVRIPNYTPIMMYRHQTETDKYENVKNMFVDDYCGGRRYLVKEEDMWKVARSVIKEFKDGQLEAGDVIVSVKAKDTDNLNYEFDNIIVYVYDGSRLLVSRKTLDGVTYEIIPEENVYTELTKLYMTDKHLFFALRPSQVER